MRRVLVGIGLGVGIAVGAAACGDDPDASTGADDHDGGSSGGPLGHGGPTTPPKASCAAEGGTATVAAPTLRSSFEDDGDEAWLASPAVADLDGDGQNEVIAARGGTVFVWRRDGQRVFAHATGEDRIWASPAIGDFVGDAALEIAVAARDSAFLLTHTGSVADGFPKVWGTETRSLGAGDVDGDGRLDLVVGVREGSGASTDVVNAYRGDGQNVVGFPPVAKGVSGCTDSCYFAGLYDQNLAVGDLDGDGKHDLVLPHDNAYASFFRGTGVAFDANPMFEERPKTPGVRYLHDLEEAKQGYSETEERSNQAHFTNTAPAIADLDGDGQYEIVMLGSVQNASQDDRLRGVGLWVVRSDASRLPAWNAPFHVPAYVLGLSDGFARELDGDAIEGAGNLVGATNQASVADLDANRAGKEIVFAGFDGRIHAVGADRQELWSTAYAENGRALTGGVVIGDLSADGVPEIVFTTYSPDPGAGSLFVLSAAGVVLHRIALPQRGSMAVPTLGDVDGDGAPEIVVSLKDAEPTGRSVQVYAVAGAQSNCLLWPTGRANLQRNGWVR